MSIMNGWQSYALVVSSVVNCLLVWKMVIPSLLRFIGGLMDTLVYWWECMRGSRDDGYLMSNINILWLKNKSGQWVRNAWYLHDDE